MAQHVIVTDYQPEWPRRYQEEAKRIQMILGDNCITIYHIGSTSVPGLAAKPIIDIMPVVKSLEKADEKAAVFERAGYEYLGEFGIAGRRYLRKGGDERTHQVHIFSWEDEENIRRHLAFRDYLRDSRKVQEEYGRLKKQLAERFPCDIEGYCDGKDDFVKRMEKIALSRYDGIWDRLYIAARKVQRSREISPFISAGGVAAALMTEAGHIYVGVCIDTASSLGMCAERNAIANMITNGESRIRKLVAVMPDGSVGLPCGACREYMMQLDQNSKEIEILEELDSRTTVLLGTLIPGWWGEKRFRENEKSKENR